MHYPSATNSDHASKAKEECERGNSCRGAGSYDEFRRNIDEEKKEEGNSPFEEKEAALAVCVTVFGEGPQTPPETPPPPSSPPAALTSDNGCSRQLCFSPPYTQQMLSSDDYDDDDDDDDKNSEVNTVCNVDAVDFARTRKEDDDDGDDDDYKMFKARYCRVEDSEEEEEEKDVELDKYFKFRKIKWNS